MEKKKSHQCNVDTLLSHFLHEKAGPQVPPLSPELRSSSLRPPAVLPHRTRCPSRPGSALPAYRFLCAWISARTEESQDYKFHNYK